MNELGKYKGCAGRRRVEILQTSDVRLTAHGDVFTDLRMG